jgi:hypothetical protein
MVSLCFMMIFWNNFAALLVSVFVIEKSRRIVWWNLADLNEPLTCDVDVEVV